MAKDLSIESKLDDVGIDAVIDEDIYRLIDFKILHELINALVHESIDSSKLKSYVKRRKNKYWYFEFKTFYACLASLALLASIESLLKNLAVGFYTYSLSGCALLAP
jgi:hypothetical protein